MFSVKARELQETWTKLVRLRAMIVRKLKFLNCLKERYVFEPAIESRSLDDLWSCEDRVSVILDLVEKGRRYCRSM